MKDLLTIISDGEKIAVRVTQSEAEVYGLNTEITELETALDVLRKKGADARERLDQGKDEFEAFIDDLPEDLDAGKAREMIDTRVAQLAEMGMLDKVELKPKRRVARKKSSKKDDAKSAAVNDMDAKKSPSEAAADVDTRQPEGTPAPSAEVAPETTDAVSPVQETERQTNEAELEAIASSDVGADTSDDVQAPNDEDGSQETDFLQEAENDNDGDQKTDEHTDLVNELAEEVAGEDDDGSELNIDDIAEMAAEDGVEDDSAENEEGSVNEDSGALDVDFPPFLRETA